MNALPNHIREVLLELESRLKDLYGKRFRGLLLYGSYARGDAWEGSDVDLLLLLDWLLLEPYAAVRLAIP